MPDSDWPPTQRRIGRGIGMFAFLMGFITGTGVVIYQPGSVTAQIGYWGMNGIGGTLALASLAALYGLVKKNWHIEWVATWFAGGAIGVYSVIAWGLVINNADLGRVSGAALATLCASLLGRKGVEFWVHSLKQNRVKRRERERERERRSSQGA